MMKTSRLELGPNVQSDSLTLWMLGNLTPALKRDAHFRQLCLSVYHVQALLAQLRYVNSV